MTTGTPPVLELLRQILELHGIFDSKSKEFTALPNADFIAMATTPTGPGKHCNHGD